MTALRELVRRIGGSCSSPGQDVAVLDVQLDSRNVRPGDLFAALPGSKDDGGRHVADAVDRGAVVVLTPHEFDLRAVTPSTPGLKGVCHWSHPQPRQAAGLAAALVQGEPAQAMAMAGITGTNGKTTTAHILGHLLSVAGLSPAVLGTAGHRLAGGRVLEASHTTPDAPSLQRLLAMHRQGGGASCVMEVSSHALAQERTAGVDFDVAVFTNLTREHLDYHGDMEAYAEAKARLFSGLRPGAAAVLNLDDPASSLMRSAAESAGARVVTYSVRKAADLQASGLRIDPEGSRLTLDGMGISTCEVRLPLRGRYNVENALAAAATARLLGASPSTTVEGLATTSAAPGRLEPVNTGAHGFSVYVDYAHTPDALERVLEALAEQVKGTTGRLIAVFGCGGDRDPGKRPQMGQVAARLADVAVVTSDNPRSEQPERIIQDILAGMSGDVEVEVEVDRRLAIERAVGMASSGDVVLVAGKGHECDQVLGGALIPFDDRLVAQEVLA